METKTRVFVSTLLSVAGHVAVIALVIFYANSKGCLHTKKPLEVVDFTIAVDPYEEPDQPDPPKEPEEVKPAPKPEPEEIPVVKPKPKPKPKKPEPKKVEKKKPEKPKIVKGKRVTRKQTLVKTTVKPKGPTMSEAEIRKFLKGRTPVTIGERTSLPANERSWNASIIKKTLYSAWRQPSRETAGRCVAMVTISLGRGGTLSNPRITSSSGSATFDQSALAAVRAVTRIPELSEAFIRETPEIIVEFKID